MSTPSKRSSRTAAATGQKRMPKQKPPAVYHELAPGWRVTADSVAWKLERQSKGEKATWGLVGYVSTLSQVLSLFAQARVRAGVEDGGELLESVRQAASELKSLLDGIKDATLILEQPKGKVR